jgi:hypothetical protein
VPLMENKHDVRTIDYAQHGDIESSFGDSSDQVPQLHTKVPTREGRTKTHKDTADN